MTHNASRFVSYASVVALAAGTLLGGIQSSNAAQATANIGAIIDNGGGVGTPTDPTPEEIAAAAAVAAAAALAAEEAAAAAIVEAEATAVSNGAIVVTPSDPSSNLGFTEPVSSAAAAASGSSGPVVSDGANEGPRESRPFSQTSASNVSIGARTSVGVSGRPNQTYAVILPGQTIYSKDGNIISLNDFQHNAGSTPSMDGGGGDTFSIGASVETVPIGEQSLIRSAPEDDTDQAATSDSTSAEANPIPSVLNIIAGTDGLSTNENQRQQILSAAFASRSPFVNIVVSYN